LNGLPSIEIRFAWLNTREREYEKGRMESAPPYCYVPGKSPGSRIDISLVVVRSY
jgi:hypothetical protein